MRHPIYELLDRCHEPAGMSEGEEDDQWILNEWQKDQVVRWVIQSQKTIKRLSAIIKENEDALNENS